MFNFRDLFARIASAGRPLSPLDEALRAMRLSKYEDALARFNALLASGQFENDERFFIENKRGVALINLGRRDEARGVFESLLERDASYAPAIVNLGNMDLESGNLNEAIAKYESAVRHDDFNAMAHFNLGVAYKKIGRTAEAVRELRRAQSLEGRAGRKQSKRQ